MFTFGASFMKRDYKILFGLVLLVYLTSVLPGYFSQDNDLLKSTQNNPCEIEILESHNAFIFQAVDYINSFLIDFAAPESSLLSSGFLYKYHFSDKEHAEFILFESDTSPPQIL